MRAQSDVAIRPSVLSSVCLSALFSNSRSLDGDTHSIGCSSVGYARIQNAISGRGHIDTSVPSVTECVCVYICLSVCLSVRALKGKRLALWTPKLVDLYHIVGTPAVCTDFKVRSKIKVTCMDIKCVGGVGLRAVDTNSLVAACNVVWQFLFFFHCIIIISFTGRPWEFNNQTKLAAVVVKMRRRKQNRVCGRHPTMSGVCFEYRCVYSISVSSLLGV